MISCIQERNNKLPGSRPLKRPLHPESFPRLPALSNPLYWSFHYPRATGRAGSADCHSATPPILPKPRAGRVAGYGASQSEMDCEHLLAL
jgi:hypothetical protein